MPAPDEPLLRLAPRAPRIESDRVLEKAAELVKGFRSELASIRGEYDSRLNSATLEPGAGLWALNSALGIGNPYQDPSAGQGTLFLANSYFPLTMNWTLLANSYMTQGLLAKFVDMVVDDGFGEGVKLKTSLLDPEEVAALNLAFAEQRDPDSYRGTRMQRINFQAGTDLTNSDLEACRLVGKWGRLFGGSGLIINTTQPMAGEFRAEALGPDTPLTFIAADRWELSADTMNTASDLNPTPFTYYGNILNRSRVARFIGIPAPSRIRQYLQSWGMSVLERAIRPINAYLKFDKVMFELMDEAKVDVFKIKGYNANLLNSRGTSELYARIQAANQAKNFQNALTMDIMDEYEQKTLSGIFPGLTVFKQELRVDLCAYLECPMNKLFGQSAGGFGSGKDSLDNYNSTVRNFRQTAKPIVKRAAKLRCQQMFQIMPEDLEVEFPPLAILDGVESEAVKTSHQNRISQRFTLGLTTGEEALDEMRRAELIDIETTELEEGLRDVEPPPSENPDEAAAGREHEKDMARTSAKDKGKPGAQRD